MKPKNRLLAWNNNVADDSALAGTHIYFWWMYSAGKLPRMAGDNAEDSAAMVKQLRRAQAMRHAIIKSALDDDCEGC